MGRVVFGIILFSAGLCGKAWQETPRNTRFFYYYEFLFKIFIIFFVVSGFYNIAVFVPFWAFFSFKGVLYRLTLDKPIQTNETPFYNDIQAVKYIIIYFKKIFPSSHIKCPFPLPIYKRWCR